MRNELKDDLIIQDYKNGETIRSLSRKYNCSREAIKYRLLKNKITLKNYNESQRTYNCNYNYFNKIDTEEKAYWLGFIYADGNLYCPKNSRKKVLQICLAGKDKEHLEKFKKSLSSEHLIYKDRSNFRFMINSEQLVNDLLKLGLSPRKSLILEFPDENIVPTNLISHFIRGYFDGDGSIFETNKNTWGFSIIGTIELITKIQKFLIDIGVSKTKIVIEKRKANNKLCYLSFGGKITYTKGNLARSKNRCNNLIILYKFLYENSSIYLNRKFEIFKNIIQKREENYDLCGH